MQSNCLIIVALCLLGLVAAKSSEGDQDQWVWRSYNRRERSFRDIDRSSPIRNSYDQKLRREPTTRRPLPGQPENDEIEDYADVVEPTRSSDTPNVGTRQFNPYGGQPNAGQFGGLGGYGGNPGVLVGPGGPTGVIGRPQLYPNPYQTGYGGFSGAQNGIGGYPGGYSGVGQGLPGAGFPGTNFNNYPTNGLGLNQFPSNGQYPYGSYPGGDFSGNQFAGAGGQFPGLGQYPGNQQFGGPQYTEGYGLAGGLGLGQLGLGNGGIGYGGSFPPLGGGFGYDEKSPAVAEGKSAKSVAAAPRNVNDKLSKKI
ncbi:shematrin-like protein 2 [Drosophila subpulchrella]|uniref:shematrin-like protein 2 n=1 Tax=Drosophila subpulchrella TaxID=1486046 RepID=UPI0018A14DAE|nr:shematrin-like protein 2 [Drosophila subpulchrella]